MAETLRTIDEELVARTEVDASGLASALFPVLISGLLRTSPLAAVGEALAPSVSAVLIEDSITNGVTTKAPSQNAVFDALALKADTSALAAYLTTAAAASTYLTISAAVIGYQPLDADLTAISALTTTSYGRALLTLADQSALRSAVGTIGDVVGPGSSTSGNVATFSGTTGKLLQDSGFTINQSLATTSSPTFAGLTVSGLTASRLVATNGSKSFVSTITSADLAASISDETGSGSAVFATSPSLTTPTIAGATLSGTFSGTAAFSAVLTHSGLVTWENASANSLTRWRETGTSNLINAIYQATGTLFTFTPGPEGTLDFAKEFGYDFTNSRWFCETDLYVGGSPAMTRGAAETVTGAKTFSSTIVSTNATALSFERASHDVWRILQGTPSSTRGIGLYNNTDALYGWFVSDDENMGIGTVDPSAKLHVAGTVRFSSFGAGTLVTDASGNISASSDADLKDIIAPFVRSLSSMRKLSGPVSYKWKEETGYDRQMAYVGFVAQDVNKGIPEAIGIGQNGMLTLQDRPILATHHNAILELEDQLTSLRAEVEELKLAA